MGASTYVDGNKLLVSTHSLLVPGVLSNLGSSTVSDSSLCIYVACGRALVADATIMCLGKVLPFAERLAK